MNFFKSERMSSPISVQIQYDDKTNYAINNAFTHITHNTFANPENVIYITDPEIYDIKINL